MIYKYWRENNKFQLNEAFPLLLAVHRNALALIYYYVEEKRLTTMCAHTHTFDVFPFHFFVLSSFGLILLYLSNEKKARD